MREQLDYIEAMEIVRSHAVAVGTERLPLKDCAGRVLARDVLAAFPVPEFDRSPYDGYSFRSADTVNAAPEHPVTLRILEEIPAGGVSHIPVTEGTAVKILTGAPIPEGADAVVMFERTSFTEETVTLFHAARPGENVVKAGEDIQAGDLLAEAGVWIDPGLLGSLAAQNIPELEVYRIPRVGIISTGSELLETGMEPAPGKIYNSNRYTLAAQLEKNGCEPCYLGVARDDAGEIAALIEEGLKTCDALVLSGGVSVGDYDCTGEAMERAGATLLFSGVRIKPGMACVFGQAGEKLICALSGNPASALTNYCVVALPGIRRLCGLKEQAHPALRVRLAEGFPKRTPVTRFLRGKLDLSEGTALVRLTGGQGNVVLSSAIGIDVLAVLPEGCGPVEPGQELEGILV